MANPPKKIYTLTDFPSRPFHEVKNEELEERIEKLEKANKANIAFDCIIVLSIILAEFLRYH